MKFLADGFDVWVFRRAAGGVRYLLLEASQTKADSYFGGGRFWQIPSDFVGTRSVIDAIGAELRGHNLDAIAVWAAEHTYTIFNRRYDSIVHVAVFAAEVADDDAEVAINETQHRRHAWLWGDEASARVNFRGLKDGIASVREYVTEREQPLPELRLL